MVFRILALAGFSYNLWCISEIFFKFQINTEISIALPLTYEPLDIHFCARYYDLIPPKVKQQKLKEWAKINETNRVRAIQYGMRANEIFELTPDHSSFFDLGELRFNGSYELILCNENACLDYFYVKKFVFMEYVCYQLSLRSDKISQYFDLMLLAVSPAFSGLSVRINLKRQFDRISVFKIALSKPGDYPYTELAVSPQRFGDHNLMLGYKSFKSRLLRAPFASDCLDYTQYGFKSRDDCYSSCIFEKTVDKTNKLPFAVIIDDRTHTEEILSYVDIQNATTSKLIHEIHDICSRKCRYHDCFKESLTTFVTPLSSSSNLFQFSLVIPVDPAVDFKMIPKMSVIEFMIFVLSTISTWTSLSIMSLDPAELLVKGSFRKCIHNFKRILGRGKQSRKVRVRFHQAKRSVKFNETNRNIVRHQLGHYFFPTNDYY